MGICYGHLMNLTIFPTVPSLVLVGYKLGCIYINFFKDANLLYCGDRKVQPTHITFHMCLSTTSIFPPGSDSRSLFFVQHLSTIF